MIHYREPPIRRVPTTGLLLAWMLVFGIMTLVPIGYFVFPEWFASPQKPPEKPAAAAAAPVSRNETLRRRMADLDRRIEAIERRMASYSPILR